MNIPLIDLKAQYQSISDEIAHASLEVLQGARYIMGDNVKAFEDEFRSYLDIKHAIGVGNGTDALVIALKALGIGEGDEVITSTYTFFATAESISAVGAVPVFVDVDADTYNIDLKLLEDAITTKTKAIIPVHIFGQACKIEKLMTFASDRNLYVIEDACQAIGSQVKDRKIGTYGDLAVFSFFPTKNLGAAGDGGMIVTNDDNLADICRALRVHGSGRVGKKAYDNINGTLSIDEMNVIESAQETTLDPQKYYNYLIGHNSRLDEIQAAILRVKLPHLNDWNGRRRAIVEKYCSEIKNDNIIIKKHERMEEHVYHMFIIETERRTELVTYLKEKGISTGVYYPVPLHLQKVYEPLNYKLGSLPVAEFLSRRTLAIPVYPELSTQQVDYIIDSINNFE